MAILKCISIFKACVRRAAFPGLLILLGWSTVAWAAPAQDTATEKIHVTADRLATDNNARTAVFSGNVRAVQGETVIRSDTLEFFFKPGVSDGLAAGIGADTVEKIIAEGHVHIEFENRLAIADHAIYVSDTKIITLTGDTAKVSSGESFVAGHKITLNRADGSVHVERGVQEPVEAVFYPESSPENTAPVE